MKTPVIALVLLCAISLSAQNHSMGSAKPVTLVTGIAITSSGFDEERPGAAVFSIRDLRFIYAFNHDEAARSFQKAAELDPNLRWRIGESPRRSGRLQTIRPAKTASSRRTSNSRKPWI